MATLLRKPCANAQQGLTLIEVLIALAIIAIALTAVIKTTAENIRATAYLKNKSIALWVGEEVINKARLGLIKLPSGDMVTEMTPMLGQDWYWQAKQEQTPNPKIFKVSVDVYMQENTEAVSPVVHLESYVYHEE